MARYSNNYFSLILDKTFSLDNVDWLLDKHSTEAQNIKNKKKYPGLQGYELLEHVEKHDRLEKETLENKHIRDTCLQLLVERGALLGIRCILEHMPSHQVFNHRPLLPVRWLGLEEHDDGNATGAALYDKSSSLRGRIQIMLHAISALEDADLKFVIANIDVGDGQIEPALEDRANAAGFTRLTLTHDAVWDPMPKEVLIFVDLCASLCYAYGR
jgi:hypothetical protein